MMQPQQQAPVMRPITAPREPPDNHEVPKIYYIGFIILYVIVMLPAISGHFLNIIFYPLTFGTAALILLYYNRQVNINTINPVAIKYADLFRGFSLTFYSAGILALVFEIWIQILFMLILAGTQVSKISSVANGGKNPLQNPSNPVSHIYNFLNAFFVAALVEESLKAFIIQHSMKRFLPFKDYLGHSDVQSIVWMGMAVGLGFGTVEGVMYVCVYGYIQGDNAVALTVTWLIRDLIAIPFHTLTGLMWGINYSKRDCLKQTVPWWMMYIAPWLFHGLYDFIEMEYAMEAPRTLGAVGGSLGIAIGIEIAAALFVYFSLKNLYLQASSERVPDEDPIN